MFISSETLELRVSKVHRAQDWWAANDYLGLSSFVTAASIAYPARWFSANQAIELIELIRCSSEADRLTIVNEICSLEYWGPCMRSIMGARQQFYSSRLVMRLEGPSQQRLVRGPESRLGWPVRLKVRFSV